MNVYFKYHDISTLEGQLAAIPPMKRSRRDNQKVCNYKGFNIKKGQPASDCRGYGPKIYWIANEIERYKSLIEVKMIIDNRIIIK